jgi:hypothetical protein
MGHEKLKFYYNRKGFREFSARDSNGSCLPQAGTRVDSPALTAWQGAPKLMKDEKRTMKN